MRPNDATRHVSRLVDDLQQQSAQIAVSERKVVQI